MASLANRVEAGSTLGEKSLPWTGLHRGASARQTPDPRNAHIETAPGKGGVSKAAHPLE